MLLDFYSHTRTKYNNSNSLSSGKLAIRFARKFSRHMKKVEIDVLPPLESSTECDLRAFSELFDAAVLKKIRLVFRYCSSLKYNRKSNAELSKAFIRLFENQNSLEVISYLKFVC